MPGTALLGVVGCRRNGARVLPGLLVQAAAQQAFQNFIDPFGAE